MIISDSSTYNFVLVFLVTSLALEPFSLIDHFFRFSRKPLID